MPGRDRLYLLPAGFEDPALDSGGRGWVCSACAMVEGFLGDFPQVRDQLDVAYLNFPRPRAELVEAIGEDHQSLPVLILAEPAEGDSILAADGVSFISDEKAILRWLAARYGVAGPHP